MALSRIEGNPPCRMVWRWGAGSQACMKPHGHTMRQGGFWFAFPRLGKDALISNDGANALTVDAEAVVPVGAARIEAEDEGVVRAVWTRR